MDNDIKKANCVITDLKELTHKRERARDELAKVRILKSNGPSGNVITSVEIKYRLIDGRTEALIEVPYTHREKEYEVPMPAFLDSLEFYYSSLIDTYNTKIQHELDNWRKLDV